MNSSLAEHHQLVGELFLRAQSLPLSDREALLRTQARSTPEAVAEVRAMLAADSGMVGLLDGRTLAAGEVAPAPTLTGGTVGRYRVVQLLGSGGMGAVYEARPDYPDRAVALKVMRTGLRSKAARDRFTFESEVLARLRHPAIAQIYDAGVAHIDGRETPYFAMEFVEGARPITSLYSDARRPPREIAALFVEVCDGVHHGHQRGVIHRDLKPDNILIDANGRPKVIDFGVARALDREADAARYTQTGQLVGTISYMSPEQLADAREGVDVRTDVYSLGVVLYELLTGRLPYAAGAPLASLISAIREGRTVAPRTAQPRLSRDLELILLKAMMLDPARRYSSAAEFGHDLQRWLRREPILARPSSAAYQLRQFVRRHKALVAGTFAVVATLAGGIVAERWRRGEAVLAQNAAEQARAAAQVDAARAARVTLFLEEMFGSVTPDEAKGREVTVREVLDRVASRIENELGDTPAVEATVRLILGQAYGELGAHREAEAMLAPALAIHEKARRSDGETVRILHKLAGTKLEIGEFPAAAATYERALQVANAQPDADRELILSILNNRGQVLYLSGQHEAAADNLREIIRLRLGFNGPDDPELPVVRTNLGMVLQQLGRLEEARDLISEALEWYRSHGQADTSSGLGVLSALAGVEFSLGRLEEAERLSRDCDERHRVHFGPDHPDLAQSLYQHGTRLANVFREAEAEALLREALRIRERAFGPDHISVADTLGRLGPVLARQDRAEEGLTHLRRSIGILRAQQPPNPVKLGWALHGFTQALVEERWLDEARVTQGEAIELLRGVYGSEAPQSLIARAMLAFVDVNDGKYAAALPECEQIVALRERILGPEHQETTIARYNLAEVHVGTGDLAAGLGSYEGVLPRLVADYGADSGLVSAACQGVAVCHLLAGRPNESHAAAQRGWNGAAAARPPSHPSFGYLAALEVASARDAGVEPTREAVDRLSSAAPHARVKAERGAWRPAFAMLTWGEELQAAGRSVEAYEWIAPAAQILRTHFGESHPMTLRADKAMPESQAAPLDGDATRVARPAGD